MVTNVQFSDQSWQQASLPARFGGLGIRSVESLALPCFLGSITSALPLMEEIYPLRGQPPIIAQAVESFSEVTGSTTIPGDESAGSQRAWDEIACEQSLKQLLSSDRPEFRFRVRFRLILDFRSTSDRLPKFNSGLYESHCRFRVFNSD